MAKSSLSRFIRRSKAVVDSLTSRTMSSFCLLETGYGKNLIGSDGSIATVLDVRGTNALGSDRDLARFCTHAAETFTPFMTSSGHAMQFCFQRDPDLAQAIMESSVGPARGVAEALQMDGMQDILDERVSHMRRYVVHEAAHIVLWTRPSVLTGLDRKRINEEMQEMRPSWWPRAIDAQALDRLSKTLATRHNEFVNSVVYELSRNEETAVKVVPLSIHGAARVIRDALYPGMGHDGFALIVPEATKAGENRVPWMTYPTLPAPDASHVMWPQIRKQLFDEGAIEDSGPGVVIRGRRYANVDVTRGPLQLKSFNRLIAAMRGMGNEPPWRASFLIEGSGLNNVGTLVNYAVAGLTAPFKVGATQSALYRDAIQGLREYADNDGAAVRTRISFATWGPQKDVQQVEERVSRLQRAIENWGTISTSTVCGDRLEGVMSSVPAIDVRSTAPAGIAPIEEVLYVLPWMREVSPFTEGSFVLRTRDGRPFPFEIASALQDSWSEIVYGAPGRGKSVLLNSLATAFILSSNSTRTGKPVLPRLATIDIGGSIEGPLDLLRDVLPEDMKHQVLFRRLRMLREDGINPFDLPLGLQKPLPQHRSLIVAIISIMASPADHEGGIHTPPEMIELVSRIIDLAYELASEDPRSGNPKRYVRGEDFDVDYMLEHLDVPESECRTWYGVARALLRRGAPREAKIAQRYAVPQLSDLLLTDQPQIASLYSDQAGSSLTKTFERLLQGAQNEYPILDGPTQIDVSSARVLGIDLTELAPKTNLKQTSIMYLLAMHLTSSEFFMTKDDLAYFPEEFQEYHRTEIRVLNETPKRLVFDEFHRTTGVNLIRRMATQFMREGRKYGFHVSVASQQYQDFDDDMVKATTNIWICGVAREEEVDEAATVFGLSPSAKIALRRTVLGPTKEGAPVLGLFRMRDGQHEHVLINTLGPREIWAYSTSQIDRAIRSRLSEILGPREARRRLGAAYPGGSAATEINRRAKLATMRSDDLNEDNAKAGAVDELVREIAEGRHTVGLESEAEAA